MPILLLPSTITWGEAKKRVARAAGSPTDPDTLLFAAEMLQTGIEHLSNFHNWKWLKTSASTTTDASGFISLPTRAKEIYDVMCAGNWLIPVPRRYYDQGHPGGELVGGTLYYDAYDASSLGKIKTIDAAATAAATVNYYRQLDVPATVMLGSTSDSTVLDVPEPYQNYVIAIAKALAASELEGEGSRQADKWMGYGEKGLALMRAREWGANEEVTFVPPAYIGLFTPIQNYEDFLP